MMCKQNSIYVFLEQLELMYVRMHLGIPELEPKLGIFEVTNN